MARIEIVEHSPQHANAIHYSGYEVASRFCFWQEADATRRFFFTEKFDERPRPSTEPHGIREVSMFPGRVILNPGDAIPRVGALLDIVEGIVPRVDPERRLVRFVWIDETGLDRREPTTPRNSESELFNNLRSLLTNLAVANQPIWVRDRVVDLPGALTLADTQPHLFHFDPELDP